MTKTLIVSIAACCVGLFVAASAQAKPDVATPDEVQNCRFIEKVSGSSGYGKKAGWTSIAKTRAEKKAGSVGASHIVWTGFRTTGTFNGSAEAGAYDCAR